VEQIRKSRLTEEAVQTNEKRMYYSIKRTGKSDYPHG
jgi:hypothetical protein